MLGSGSAGGFSFDDGVVISRVVAQVSLINSQKQHPIALRHEIPTGADEDEVVIIIANHGDQATGRLIAHQFFSIRKAWHTIGRRETAATHCDAAGGVDAQALATPHDQTTVRLAIAGTVSTDPSVYL